MIQWIPKSVDISWSGELSVDATSSCSIVVLSALTSTLGFFAFDNNRSLELNSSNVSRKLEPNSSTVSTISSSSGQDNTFEGKNDDSTSTVSVMSLLSSNTLVVDGELGGSFITILESTWSILVSSGTVADGCISGFSRCTRSITSFLVFTIRIRKVRSLFWCFKSFDYNLIYQHTSIGLSGFFPSTSSLNAQSCSRALGCFEWRRCNARTNIGSNSADILNVELEMIKIRAK